MFENFEPVSIKGEALEHDRHDSIKEFARGNVLFSVGGNTYTAEVLVGTRADGSMLLYDIVGIMPLEITETGRGNMVELDKEPSHRHTSDSNNIITDAERKSNPQFQTLNDMVAEKFAPQVREGSKPDGPMYSIDEEWEIADASERETAAREAAALADVSGMDTKTLRRTLKQEQAAKEERKTVLFWLFFEQDGYCNGCERFIRII